MTQQVRAKFYVTGVQAHPAEGEKAAETIHLHAVTSASEDDPNKSWSKWTPSGSAQMYVTNPNVFGFFEQGKEYYLDFVPVCPVMVEPTPETLANIPAEYPSVPLEEVAEAVKETCGGNINEALQGGLIDRPIADELHDQAAELGLQ